LALHDPPLEVPFINTKTGFVTEPWAKWLIINKRDKANRIEDGTEDNVMLIDDTGNPKDGSKALPSGDFVGLTDAQELANKTFAELVSTKILASDGSSGLEEIDLSAWVAGTANKITVTDDGDGTITLTIPNSPVFVTPIVVDLTNMVHDHKDAANGGDYAWADMVLAATQADASAISAVTLTAGADTVDITACNATLATMRTEINAIVTAFNALIDKLQTANQMT